MIACTCATTNGVHEADCPADGFENAIGAAS